MSVARINAVQLAVAALIGALAVVAGAQSLDRQDARQDVERSAALLANAVAHRVNGALVAVTRAIELTVTQQSIATVPEAQALVENWSRARPAYAAVVVISPTGRIVAASQSRLIGQDVAYEAWFDAARSGTTIADSAAGRGLTTGRATEAVVASPAREPGGGLRGVVAITLGERWFGEATEEAKRAVALGDQLSSLTILSGGGAVLYRSGSAVSEATGTSEASARMAGADSAADWTTLVRLPLGPSGSVQAVPWALVQAGLLAAAAMAAAGWWLGRMADRKVAEVCEAAGPASPEEPRSQEGMDRLAGRVAALRDREGQAARTGRDSRMALSRIRDRLHAFEGLSGWTYWSIDLEQGHATWSHRVPGSQNATERTMSLDQVTNYVMAEDRELLQLTLQAASEGDGAHDIELRLSGAGRDGRRLLVRLERAVDTGSRRVMLHALTREIAADTGARTAASDSAAAERRQSSSLLRSVIDGVVIDLNDVLTLAISSLDALRARGGDPVIIDRTMRGLWRGAGLTGRMVAFVRQQIPSLQTADLADVVDGLRPFLIASLPPTVRLDLRLDDVLQSVRCSERQLELMLMNLALHVNARSSHVSVIRIEARDLGQRVLITIAADHVGRRPSRDEPAVGHATENGLAAVRMMVSQVSGELTERDDEDGYGFELALPADRAAEPRPVAAEGAGSARILLVTGDALMRATLAETLRDLGHLVEEARSGAVAVSRLGQASFDVLITEQNLPVMSGLQLAATARRLVPGLKIVIASPRGELPRSVDAFLTLDKPFGRAELAHVLSLPMPDVRVSKAA